MQPDLEPILRNIVDFLDGQGYRYAVIGGIALSLWGVVRVTRDIDIKVFVPDADYDSKRKAIGKAFPEKARVNLPTNPLITSVYIGGTTVDFLFTIPGYEEQIIERAVSRDLGGWSIWVCSAEDLIIQKAAAGREKDWMDIESIVIEQHKRLNYAYIHDWLEQFVEALEKPEILARYREILAKVEQLESKLSR